ncbi:hypothetical protein NQ318_013494, partial [Aromia moschata]
MNIWCGVISNFVIKTFQLPPKLTGPRYLNCLQHHLNELLEDVQLTLRENMWFMQDGALPHFALPVHQYLHEHFPHRWIGRGNKFVWPPRSPDLPLAFSELQQRIQEAANTFKNNMEILFNSQKHLE